MRLLAVMASVLLASSAFATPTRVGRGTLDPFVAPAISVEKGRCYTLLLELDEGATVDEDVLHGYQTLSVDWGKGLSSVVISRIAPRRYTARLRTCVTTPASRATIAVSCGEAGCTRPFGSGGFTLSVESRPASASESAAATPRPRDRKREREDARAARRDVARELCEVCVSRNAGNLRGFRQCLADQGIRASECL